MSDCSTHAFDVPLKPCPFCSAEPEVLSDGHRTWGLVQHNEGCLFPVYPKHEIPESDFAAWNTRAPIEYEGWFFLPKPKDGIVDYGEPEITRTENSYKIKQPVEVIDSAIRSWGDELGDYVMKRICEVWNSRAERTCEPTNCDSGEMDIDVYALSCGHVAYYPSVYEDTPSYCPECGARVVGE